MTERVLKVVTNHTQTRRLHIVERADGRFGFREEARVFDDKGRVWTTDWQVVRSRYAPGCDRAISAEIQARAAVPWFASLDAYAVDRSVHRVALRKIA